jgi:hypothetical protein
MKQPPDDFKTTYARLKAWRDALRRGGKNRRDRATPFKRAFSPRSKPREKGDGSNEKG